MVDAAVVPFLEDDTIACVNLSKRLDDAGEYANPNTIKVVSDLNDDAMYMTRAPIPTLAAGGIKDTIVCKQVFVIVFTRAELEMYTQLPETPLERFESIDMLRLMEHKRPVRMIPTERDTQAVDCQADLDRVELLMADDELLGQY